MSGSFSRINFRCNLCNSTDQVSARVFLWKGRPAGATTTQILSFKSHSSSINYWLSVPTRSRSLAHSLPEPPFTSALSAGVIISTNCRLDVLGQWGHSIAPSLLFQRLIIILWSRVNVAARLRSVQTQHGRENLRDNHRVEGADMVYGTANTIPGTGHLGLDKDSAKVPYTQRISTLILGHIVLNKGRDPMMIFLLFKIPPHVCLFSKLF